MKQVSRVICVLLIIMFLSSNIVYGANYDYRVGDSGYIPGYEYADEAAEKIYNKIKKSLRINLDLKKNYGGKIDENTDTVTYEYSKVLTYKATAKVSFAVYHDLKKNEHDFYLAIADIDYGNKEIKSTNLGLSVKTFKGDDWKKQARNWISEWFTKRIDEDIWYAGEIKINANDISDAQLESSDQNNILRAPGDSNMYFIHVNVTKTVKYKIEIATPVLHETRNAGHLGRYQGFCRVSTYRTEITPDYRNDNITDVWEIQGNNDNSSDNNNNNDNSNNNSNNSNNNSNNSNSNNSDSSSNPGGIEDGTVIGSLNINKGTAFTDPTTNANSYKPANLTTADTGELTTMAGTIIGIVRNIGVVLGVIFLTVLGLRYMFASIAEKAEYKETMMPYALGAILLMAGTVLVDVIYHVATTW